MIIAVCDPKGIAIEAIKTILYHEKDFQTVSVVFMSFGIWNSCWMPAEIVLSTALFFPITAIPTIV